MPMNDLMKHSDNHSKTSVSLWQYYRDEPTATISNSKSFKFKIRTTLKAPADANLKDVKIVALLKYLNAFLRNLEIVLTLMPNCFDSNRPC